MAEDQEKEELSTDEAAELERLLEDTGGGEAEAGAEGKTPENSREQKAPDDFWRGSPDPGHRRRSIFFHGR